MSPVWRPFPSGIGLKTCNAQLASSEPSQPVIPFSQGIHRSAIRRDLVAGKAMLKSLVSTKGQHEHSSWPKFPVRLPPPPKALITSSWKQLAGQLRVHRCPCLVRPQVSFPNRLRQYCSLRMSVQPMGHASFRPRGPCQPRDIATALPVLGSDPQDPSHVPAIYPELPPTHTERASDLA